MSDDTTTTLEPVVREVTVRAPVDTCFRVFVDEYASWWPPEHHIGEDRTVTGFFIEPSAGGRCYDVDTEGVECQWGTVLEVDRPRRLLFAWHIQGDWTIDLDPALQSEVEVTFTAGADGTTTVRLEHRNLDRHRGGEGVRQGVGNDQGGWGFLIKRFADVAEGRSPRPLTAPPTA
jgi:uncharacterized protein YndB with AHSA1/START domain